MPHTRVFFWTVKRTTTTTVKCQRRLICVSMTDWLQLIDALSIFSVDYYSQSTLGLLVCFGWRGMSLDMLVSVKKKRSRERRLAASFLVLLRLASLNQNSSRARPDTRILRGVFVQQKRGRGECLARGCSFCEWQQTKVGW